MDIEIIPILKPLYANLLRIGLPSYLTTERFDHLLLENDWDDAWNQCEKYVRQSSSALILIPGYTGYAEKALGLFLNHIYKNARPKYGFFIVLETILNDFMKWKERKVDLSKVYDSVKKIGISEEKFEEIFANS